MSASGSRDFDAIIVGAGVIGAAMASLLVSRRLSAPGRVAIIADRFPAPGAADADWDLRVFALGRASERLLKVCGVWDSLPRQRVFAYERMCVWDAAGEPNGIGSLNFDCAEIGEPNLGHIVDGQILQWQCLQAARKSGAVLIESGLAAVACTDAHVSVRLTDGREVRGQLLIGADGPQSRTRELLGIETAGHAYDQDALAAHVRTQKPHCNTAWQRFLSTGPVAFLPLSDERSSIVWTTTPSESARLRALDPEAFGSALASAAGDALGACELSTSVASFPLKLQYALEYTRPRAVLIGDAAHVVHPLAGQGLNLGLLDCAVLADVLGGGGNAGAGVGAGGSAGRYGEHRLLRRYERRRRSENLLAAAALDGIERLFSNADPWSSGVRGAALHAAGSVPFIKRHLAQRALGLAGDVPAFLKTGSGGGSLDAAG